MSTTKPEQELEERPLTPTADGRLEVADAKPVKGECTGVLCPHRKDDYDEELIKEAFVPLNRDDEELIKEASYTKCFAGLFRSFFTLIIAIIGLILGANDFSLARITAVCVALIFLTYLVRIWIVFCKADRIYRIYTIDAVPRNWMDMSISFVNMEHRMEPLQSISEFSAISGGFGKTALLRVGTIAWVAAAFVVVIKMQDKNYGFSKCLSRGLFCQFLGAFGLDTIGTFYLDPYSMLMKTGHYTGVLLCLSTMVGLWMQSCADGDHYVLTSLVTGVGAIFFVLFLVYYPYIYKPTSAELAKHETVTSISRTILLFESIGLGMAAVSFILFLWFED